MIEGRPRESLVQFENPIEVSHIYLLIVHRSLEDKATIRLERISVSINSNLKDNQTNFVTVG